MGVSRAGNEGFLRRFMAALSLSPKHLFPPFSFGLYTPPKPYYVFNLIFFPDIYQEKQQYSRHLDVPAVKERTDNVHAELLQFFETMFKDMPKPRTAKSVAPSLLI